MPAPRTTSAGSKSSPTRKSSPKSAATKTTRVAKAGAEKTARSASQGGARSTAKSAGTKTRRSTTSSRADAVAAAQQRPSRSIKPRDLVMLTRERIQETLDEAAARGRVTRKDANELVAELVRRGRSQTDELVGDLEQLLERGREQLETATRRARKTEPVDRLVRGADRARRAAGVGPSFPILGYDDLNVGQVRERLKDLRKPELRKVRDYESKHANRKSVIGAIDKALA
jgi:polyhydroxyalkanoate synthesis regulator phasin